MLLNTPGFVLTVFLLVFDEGLLRDDVDEARKEVEATLALMTDTPQAIPKEKYPLRYMFNDIWLRLSKVMTILWLLMNEETFQL